MPEKSAVISSKVVKNNRCDQKLKKDSHISIESILFYLYNAPDIIIKLMFYVEFVMWEIHYIFQIVKLFPLQSVFP